ncbi:MAG: AAA family ATPase, partial [Lachnospiraceae bacterium]|nr:AAA family ATPase [Lachnospiraceae bacterium]
MTSNIGSQSLLDGIDDEGNISEFASNMVMEQLRASFRPEFLNRLDEIIMFKPLTRSDIGSIINLQLTAINKLLAEKEISLSLTEAAKELVADRAYDPAYGARPLKRYLQKNVTTLAAKIILEGNLDPNDEIVIDVDEHGELTARVK